MKKRLTGKDKYIYRKADDLFKAFTKVMALEEVGSFGKAMGDVIRTGAKPIPEDGILTNQAVVVDGKGTRHSLKSMKHDIADGKMFRDLMEHCGFTKEKVGELRDQLRDLVEYMTPYRDIVDINEPYGKEGRRYSPYKPNSDPLYAISLDYSTLCSKRLLTQYVIEQLQLRENRPMSAEEQLAIRDMLIEYRAVEKGLEVACAMCYVEAARLKSPKQIQKWLDDPATEMRNYFANKNAEFEAYVTEEQNRFKELRGYNRNTPKKDMKAKDLNIDFTITDGRVNTKPFNIKLGDYVMNLSGSTGLDQTIDYRGKITIPESAGVASKIGTVDMTIGGTFTSPKVGIDMESLAKQAAKQALTEVGKKLLGTSNNTSEEAADSTATDKQTKAAQTVGKVLDLLKKKK
jgi:hypothetical protein